MVTPDLTLDIKTYYNQSQGFLVYSRVISNLNSCTVYITCAFADTVTEPCMNDNIQTCMYQPRACLVVIIQWIKTLRAWRRYELSITHVHTFKSPCDVRAHIAGTQH
jgi:hypothetical protein